MSNFNVGDVYMCKWIQPVVTTIFIVLETNIIDVFIGKQIKILEENKIRLLSISLCNLLIGEKHLVKL